jgi:C1A family cysteine protease
MLMFRPGAFGWHRDLPDPRDFGPRHSKVLSALRDLDPIGSTRVRKADWSDYFNAVDDSLGLATCVSSACVGLAEYFERRSSGATIGGSRLFLHQSARRLAGHPESIGASSRATLKALARFGLPPERCWPYEAARLLVEPEPFLYSFARKFESLLYVRLDPFGSSGRQVLHGVRSHLASGFPSVFGFSAFESLTSDADVAFPSRFNAVLGGSTGIAVGYDDSRRIRSTKGALRVRTNWGRQWGEAGYGWLPYAYVEEGLAVDFWTMLRPDWLASGEFSRPDVPT